MHAYVRAAFVGSTALFGIALLHACVESRRAPTSPSPGVERSGQAIGWECLRPPQPDPDNVTGPWTFPQVSEACAATAVTAPALGAPVTAPVRNLRATVTGTTVRLDWDPPLNDSWTGYQVEVGSGPGLINLAIFQVFHGTPFVVVNNVPTGAYYVRVRGTGGPLGPASNEVLVLVGVPCANPPGPPVNFTHNLVGNNVSLFWNAPTTGEPPSSYVIEAGTATGLANVVVFNTGNVATALNVGAPIGLYFARVRARNACGVGGPSNERIIGVGVTTTTTSSPTTAATTTVPAATTTAPATTTALSSSTSSSTAASTVSSTISTTTAPVSFSAVYANMTGCSVYLCHGGGPHTPEDAVFSTQAEAYVFAVARSDPKNPDGSELLQKASGVTSHDGGAPWPNPSAAYTTARNWMTSGMAK